MKDPKGEFAPCHSIHNPQPVYEDCVFDACRDNPRDICEIMKDYADSCATDGTSLAWRKPDRCRESCFVVVVVFVCGCCMWRRGRGGGGNGGGVKGHENWGRGDRDWGRGGGRGGVRGGVGVGGLGVCVWGRGGWR